MKNRSHRNFLRLTLAAVTLSASSAPLPSLAQQSALASSELIEVAVASDASERLEIASRLRTLTQQLAAASCTFASGILPDESRSTIEQAKLDFERYIAALRYGEPELGTLNAETDRKILHDLELVEQEWSVIEQAVVALLADPTNEEQAKFIDDHNMTLLNLTDRLASDIKGHYSNAFQVTARDSMMIELAGRQLMLTQKMAKDSCEIWAGYNIDAARADLASTMEIFGTSLEALRFGKPSFGIPAAPNEVIATDLDSLLSRWAEIEMNLQVQLEGADLTDAQKGLIFHEFQVELAELKILLGHYREYAERNI